MKNYKGIKNRKIYIDFEGLYEPSWQIREVQKLAHEKNRAIKRLDPFGKCAGRKRAYENPEELRDKTEEYFEKQKCFKYDRFGQPIRDPETGEKIISTKPLTLSGLALHLGISTVTLKRYQAISNAGLIPPEYAEIVLEARQRIEEYAESRGYDKDGAAGSKFILKAGFGWKEPLEKSNIEKNKNDIQVQKALLKIRQDESAAKLKLMDLDESEDNEINITISRKGE